jgi:hypothetical protein
LQVASERNTVRITWSGIHKIKTQIGETTFDYDREKLQERLAKPTKVAA